MKARSICAVVGIAAAVGAVVFSQSLITTNDAQSLKVAERLLVEVPVAKGAKTCSVQVDFRPDGRVMQGPPMMAFLASVKEASGVTLKKGETKTLTAKILPENAYDKTVIWTSGDDKIATVKDGVVTAVEAGTVEITVTSTASGVSAKCRITVE